MELYIKNYRNLIEKKFTIHNNRLILVGKNSVGKSNVLSALKEGSFQLIGSKTSFKEVIYISDDAAIDKELKVSDDSSLLAIFNRIAQNSSNKKIEDFLNDVNDNIKTVGTDCQFAGDIFNIKAMYDAENGIYFEKNGKNINLDIGSGLKRRLIFIMLGKLAEYEMENKFIIAVDSPELYSHPAMIRVFCKELRELSKKGHLVVVVTHSGDVVGNLYKDVGEIAKISLESEGLEVVQVNLKEYMSQIRALYNTRDIFRLPNGKSNTALSHIVNNDLEAFTRTILRGTALKVLFADYIVIGEGSSEDVLFDFLFNETHSKILSSRNIDYIAAFGKFYLPFYFIFANLYKVDVVCVYDIDNLDNRCHKAFYKAFNKYKQANTHNFYIIEMRPDLESEMEIRMANHRVEKPLHIYNELRVGSQFMDAFVKRLEEAITYLCNNN